MMLPSRRLGVIEISSAVVLSSEAPLGIPPEILTLFARLRLPRQRVSVQALTEMLATDALETAALQLADAKVDLIVLGCTTASLLGGMESDAQVADRIRAATGVEATTTASAVVAALRDLGARRISVGTPYPDEVNQAEKVFLEECGFEVVHIEGLGLNSSGEIGALSSDAVRDLARQVAVVPSDAVFLSCTNMPTLSLLESLGEELGRPVVSSNGATFWHALRRLSVG